MLIFLCLLSASVFNVNGIGEDRSIFYVPFTGVLEKAQVEFVVRPEYTLMTSNGSSRGLFWFNPFRIELRVPVTPALALSLGSDERFSQASDIYLESDPLNLHYRSQGGIEEVRAHGHFRLPLAEFCAGGSFFFGSSREIWDYDMSNYVSADTVQYHFLGRAFRAGLSVGFGFAAYEGLGRFTMEKTDRDSACDLPGRLTAGIQPKLGPYTLTAVFECAWWPDKDPVNRFCIGASRGRIRILYFFNPWYLEGIMEHRLAGTYQYPVKNLGTVGLTLQTGYRSRNDLAEFDLIPELKITFEELFSRRKK